MTMKPPWYPFSLNLFLRLHVFVAGMTGISVDKNERVFIRTGYRQTVQAISKKDLARNQGISELKPSSILEVVEDFQ
jgi:hypothetical protein